MFLSVSIYAPFITHIDSLNHTHGNTPSKRLTYLRTQIGLRSPIYVCSTGHSGWILCILSALMEMVARGGGEDRVGSEFREEGRRETGGWSLWFPL